MDNPIVNENAYASEDTGDTPSPACIEMLTPSDKENNPKMYTKSRFIIILL